MQYEIQQKCDQLIRNYNAMKPGNGLEYNSILCAGASLYLAMNREVDAKRLKECRKILRKKRGIFSNYRGISEFIVRCKMALSDDPVRYLDDLDVVYRQLKNILSGEQTLLAAMVIAESAPSDQHSRLVEETRSIHKEMRKAHPWLTSEEDLPFAAIMACYSSDAGSIYKEAERIYEILGHDLHASMESRQMMSHILSIYSGSSEDKCRKIIETADGLKQAGHRLGRDRYITMLGTLASTNIPSAELVEMIGETDDYLKNFKPFKGIFGVGRYVRRMFAVQMVEASLNRDESGQYINNTNISSMISASIEVTIITLVTLYIIIATTASSTSHNSSS